MSCPNCRSRSTGRVGVDQYYCWDCCVEWVETESGPRLYVVDEEGELISFEDRALMSGSED